MVKKSSSFGYSISQTKVKSSPNLYTFRSQFFYGGKPLYLDFNKVSLMMYGYVLFIDLTYRDNMLGLLKSILM